MAAACTNQVTTPGAVLHLAFELVEKPVTVYVSHSLH